jgi:hypothetical protein
LSIFAAQSNAESIPKLLNLVKNVGLLQFSIGNMISPNITGTVEYKSQILLKVDPDVSAWVRLTVSFLGHSTVAFETGVSSRFRTIPGKDSVRMERVGGCVGVTVEELDRVVEEIRHEDPVDDVGADQHDQREDFGQDLGPLADQGLAQVAHFAGLTYHAVLFVHLQ